MTEPTPVIYRPGVIEYVEAGGSTTYLDAVGTARQVVGIQPDGTVTTVDLNGPPPPAPSAPTVTALYAGLSVAWDGNLTDTLPLDFDHVEVHASATTGFTPDDTTLFGTMRKAGSMPASPLTVGQVFYVRLVAVNTSGNKSGASAQMPGTPSGVAGVDIAPGSIGTTQISDDAITNAKIAAGAVGATEVSFTARDIGGITTTIASSAPGSPKTNDLWFDSGNGYRLNQWSGAAWVPVQFGTNAISAGSVTAALIAANTITASQIAAGTITATQIAANAIGTNQLAANAVTAGKIAANTITAGQIAANTITASQMAVNSITAAAIAAGSVTADKLDANLVLTTALIAGSLTGARVQVDSTGINAYDPDGNNTVSIGSDGSAVFNGSSVYANYFQGQTLEIDAGDNGGILKYSSSSAALNANSTFAANAGNWSGVSSTTVTYSSTHTYNGHNTMRGIRTGGPATAASNAFAVTAGSQYQVTAQVLSSSGTPIRVSIRWLNSGGTEIGHVWGSPSPSNANVFYSVTASGQAPAGATQAIIWVAFAAQDDPAAFYVGYCACKATNQLESWMATAGTDAYGTTYPAGLSVLLASVGKLTAGNIDAGSNTLSTTSSGRVSINNKFASTSAKYVASIGDDNSLYTAHQLGPNTSTVDFQIRRTDTGAAAAGGQTVSLWFIGMLP